MNDFLSINSARAVQDLYEQDKIQREILERIAEDGQRFRDLQSAGAKANIETRDQLIEQNELLRKQLSEQTEINQRLEHEFKMGAREAVFTRRKANWSLIIAIVSLIMTTISIITNM